MVQLADVGALVGDIADQRGRGEQIDGQLLLVRGVRSDGRNRRARAHVGRAKDGLGSRRQTDDEVCFAYRSTEVVDHLRAHFRKPLADAGQRRLRALRPASPQPHRIEVADGGDRLDMRQRLGPGPAHEQTGGVGARKLVERNSRAGCGSQLGDHRRLHHCEGLPVGAVEELDQANDARQPHGPGPLLEERHHFDCSEEPVADGKPAGFDAEVAIGRRDVPKAAVQRLIGGGCSIGVPGQLDVATHRQGTGDIAETDK
jgi:hypothetical protein